MLVILFSINNLYGSTNQNEKELEKVSLQLQWLDQFQFAGYYIAKEKGFYKDVGLDVEIKKYNFGILPLHEVINKKVTYGIGRSSLIIDKSNGSNIKLLASIFQSSPLILLATEDSGIKTIKDFIGKKVMITKDAETTVSLRAMANKEGVYGKDVFKIKHTFDIKDLVNKKTDLMASYISNEPYYLNKMGIKYKVFDPKDYGFDFYSDILFTSNDEAKNNPKRVNLFKKASLKGWEYAFNNIDETVELILKKYNSQNKSKNSLIYEAYQLKKLAYYNNKKLGDIEQSKIERIYDIYNVIGFVNKKFDFDDFIYSDDKYRSFKVDLNLTQEEKDYINSHSSLKVHNESSWPPFNFNVNGVPKGFTIDYINLLAKKLDIDIEYISGYSWNEFMEMLQTSKLDVIINISKNKEREKTINFTKHFYTAQNAIYTHKNNSNFNSLNSLNGKTIAMPNGFFAQKFIEKNYPKIKQVLVKNQVESLKLLSLGKVDATVGKKVVMDYIIRNNNISEILVTGFIDDKRSISEISLGVSKQDKVLRDILQKAQNYVDDEELDKLKQKWFGVETKELVEFINLTKKEKNYLFNKKLIKMCVDPDWIPIEKIENGKHIGLSSDYMKLISTKIDTPIKLVVTSSWEESLHKAKNRECDILSMASKTISREEYLDFPSPYISIPTVIATKPTQIYTDNIKSHLDKTWGIVKGYALAEELIRIYPDIKIVDVDSLYDGMRQVEEGKIFGYIDNSIVVRDAIQKHFLGTISITGRVDLYREYTVGVRNDEKLLYDIFDKAILSIDLKTKQQILNRWVTANQTVKKDYTLVWQILIVVVIIFMFMIYRHKILNNNNNKLEKSIQKATKNLKKRNHTLVKQQRELEESVKNFQNLFDTTMEMIVMFKPNGEIIEINHPGVVLGGFKNKSELIGKNISDFILKSEMPKVQKAMLNDTTEPYELTMVNKDGEKVYTLISGRNIIRDGQQIRISSIVNLTEIKQKDKYIQQQSKLALMGEMISMIAHQWRQPLNIIGAINMKIETKLDFDEEITSQSYAPISDDINKQLRFMSRTIDDFRDFFKPNKEKEETNFTKLVDSSLGMVESSIKSKHIKVIKELDCEDMFVTYSNEVTQVILNIIKNAEDILIDRDIKKPYIKLVSYKKGNKNILDIIDNGGGIPDKIIDKVFDPYFSTKLEKNGTGLGLYMSKTIIEEHCSGELTVKNKDKGVVFRISL